MVDREQESRIEGGQGTGEQDRWVDREQESRIEGGQVTGEQYREWAGNRRAG